MVSQLNKTQKIVLIGMFAAISTVLYFIAEIPIIPLFPHLKIDLSDIPVMLSGIVLGPVPAVLVALLKNVIHLMRTSSFGIGETMNFIVSIALVLPVSLIYNKKRKKLGDIKSFLLGSVVGFISIIVFGLIGNAILYPVFMFLLGQGIASAGVFISYLLGTVTMNIVKTAVTLIPVLPLLKPLKRIQFYG